MKENTQDRVTPITIFCKDGSKRVIKTQGKGPNNSGWNHSEAAKLGAALEGENFLSISL